MKPTLVDACNHFDHGKSTCTKCGRSLPDVCLEFEEMKKKAEAFDLQTTKVEPTVTTEEPKEAPRAKNPPRRR